MQRRILHFDGRIQGVGFRYTTQNIAMQYAVRGYIYKMSDGRVELVMEGEDREMDGVLNSLRQKMNGYIRNVQSETYPATGEFDNFCIRH